MFKRFSRNRYGYSRWDGTQAVDPFTPSDLMEHLADRLLDRGGPDVDQAVAVRHVAVYDRH